MVYNRVKLTSLEILAKSSCSSYVSSNSPSTVQRSANSIRYQARKVDSRWKWQETIAGKFSLKWFSSPSRRGSSFRARIANLRRFRLHHRAIRTQFRDSIAELEARVLDLIPQFLGSPVREAASGGFWSSPGYRQINLEPKFGSLLGCKTLVPFSVSPWSLDRGFVLSNVQYYLWKQVIIEVCDIIRYEAIRRFLKFCVK